MTYKNIQKKKNNKEINFVYLMIHDLKIINIIKFLVEKKNEIFEALKKNNFYF